MPILVASREETPSAATTTGAPKLRPSLARTPAIRPVRSSTRGLSDGDAGDELCALRPGVLGEPLIQHRAATDHAEVGEVRQLGPGHLEGRNGAAVDAQPAGVLPAGLLGDVDAEPDELADGARGETVSADLVAGEGLLLQQGDRQAAPGQVRGRGGPARPGADHDHVVIVAPLIRHCRLLIEPQSESIVPEASRHVDPTIIRQGKTQPKGGTKFGTDSFQKSSSAIRRNSATR
jgi:hypothetical protein